MNEFFVAEPSSCDSSGDLRFLVSLFGPQAGRYLADYPATWTDKVREHCESQRPVEAERIKAILRRARENAALLRNNSLPWNEEIDWLENVRYIMAQRPGDLSRVITSRSRHVDGMPTIDELEISPTADEAIEAIASEYVRVSKTLILISPELSLIDPYLDPCKRDRREVLVSLLRTVARGKCQRLTCWARASAIVGDRLHTWDEVKLAITEILLAADWPKSREFRYKLLDDSVSSVKMHDRYMISIKGGIRFGQGFQRLSKGRNDVSPLGVAVHQDLIKTYHDGEQDMKVHYEFQY